MRNRLFFVLLVLGIELLITGMNGGCGSRTYTLTTYYYPDWTLDGKIICAKKFATYEEGYGFPTGVTGAKEISASYYITTMSTEGTQEADIKQINKIGKVSASPLGNYIAYTDGDFVRVITASGNDVGSFDTGANIENIDWAPDESKLVYGSNIDIETDRIVIVNRDGTNKIDVVSGRTPSWSPTAEVNKIVFSGDEGKITFYDLTLNSTSEINVVGFQFGWLKEGIGMLFVNNGIWRINIDGTGGTQLIGNGYYTPKISPNGSKIVGGKMDDSGIWIFNIEGTGQTKVK